MTIGDVLAVVASVLGMALTTWSLLLGMTLLFKQRALYAQEYIEKSPQKVLGIGVLLTATLGVLSIVLLNHPHGLVKLIGWAMLLSLLAISVLGAGGLAFLVNSRIRSLEPSLSEFSALVRGSAILIIAGLMPLLGWFVFAPLAIIISLGAGLRAILHKEQVAPQLNSVPVEATQWSDTLPNTNSFNPQPFGSHQPPSTQPAPVIASDVIAHQ